MAAAGPEGGGWWATISSNSLLSWPVEMRREAWSSAFDASARMEVTPARVTAEVSSTGA